MIKRGKLSVIVLAVITILFSFSAIAGDYLSFQGNVDLSSTRLASEGGLVWKKEDLNI